MRGIRKKFKRVRFEFRTRLLDIFCFYFFLMFLYNLYVNQIGCSGNIGACAVVWCASTTNPGWLPYEPWKLLKAPPAFSFLITIQLDQCFSKIILRVALLSRWIKNRAVNEMQSSSIIESMSQSCEGWKKNAGVYGFHRSIC